MSRYLGVAPTERVWNQIDEHGPDFNGAPCWLWTGTTDRHGYAQATVQGRKGLRVHRLLYFWFHGPPPADLELDHLCRTPACVNPAHLEPVTHAENVRRGDGAKRFREATHCPQNHPYDEHNTYRRPDGARVCRECRREARRRYNKARRVAA